MGCSGFPDCTYTRGLDGEEQEAPETTDEMCPNPEHAEPTPMVVRSGRFGKFLSCSKYPECKERKQLVKPLGVKCPKTGGDVVERRTKRGRIFYGCTDYPDCDFTTWSRPLETPCPNCKYVIVADKDGKAKCLQCDWKGENPTSEPAAA